VIDRVAALVEKDHVALLGGPTFDLEHLVHLEQLEPRVREVERNRDRGHVVGRLPFEAEVAARARQELAPLQCTLQLRDARFELAPFDLEPEVADADLEELLVRH